MRLSKLEGALIAVIALTVAAVVAILWRQSGPTLKPGAGEPAVAAGAAAAMQGVERASAARPAGRPGTVRRATNPAQRTVADVGRFPPTRIEHAAGDTETPEEKAVADWERAVDLAIAQTNAPVELRARQVKEAFDKLADDAKEENIRRLLNLTPDDQFGLVSEILFDKTCSENVLDAIFSDALNRPEEIKVPIMKRLVQDKKHPMFFESARILDITGELSKKPAAPPATAP